MATRADFYIGRGRDAVWLGSIAFDGYPGGITPTIEKQDRFGIHESGEWPDGKHLFDSATEIEFRERVTQFFANRSDVTMPEQGWPWPWEDSRTTDFAYAFDAGKVWASCFGNQWFDPHEREPEKEGKVAIFPNMKDRKNVTLGPRSGLIVMGIK